MKAELVGREVTWRGEAPAAVATQSPAEKMMQSTFGGLATLKVVLGLSLLTGCLGFDPTPPPAAELSFELDLPADTAVSISFHDENEQLLDTVEKKAGSSIMVKLPARRDYVGLRITAIAGQRVLKAFVPEISRGQSIDLGKIDAPSTAAAQLVQQKVAGQGGSFSAMPVSGFRDLAKQIEDGNTQIAAFVEQVKKVVAVTDSSRGKALFHALDARLDDDGAAEAKISADDKTAYRNALTAAVESLRVSIVCDAALIKVMFTVDTSGQALDGNGVPQLIRQPPASGKVFIAITVDDSSTIPDSSGILKTQMTPNDPDTVMYDDGSNGDEVAGDGIFTRVLVLPRGMRIKYKYTNGSAGQGWTRTEEWPGNARILEVRDVISRDGQADCLVIRRDVFGDEATNKNHVNLNAKVKASGGNLSFGMDLGGAEVGIAKDGVLAGGLDLGDARDVAPLTPAGLPEAAENGACTRCPAPLTSSTDDTVAPEVISARFLSTEKVQVNFSEGMEFSSAGNPGNYRIRDNTGRDLPVVAAAASGSQVILTVGPPNFERFYSLEMKNLKDASAAGNPLAKNRIDISEDKSPPEVVAVRSAPLRDLNPGATDDPTLGQVVVVEFNEQLDQASAEDISNYSIESSIGIPLTVKGAFLKNAKQVWLVTDPQKKRRAYNLTITAVRDLSRNPLKGGGDALRFSGFALFKITFGAVPGFAFLDPAGAQRGLPAGSKLYLTGTVLAVARDLDGNPISISGRTDVTGVPAFEMKPSEQLYEGKPVYKITLLAPAGTYAWKVAHGIEGEWRNPPTTLVKVHKSLCTTNDATGVDIDPVTLRALAEVGADDKKVGGLDYSSATISTRGADDPGPFDGPGGGEPKPKIMYKRENPDEVCVARSSDVVCPAIIVGTWRDLPAFTEGNNTNDYDDGLPEVAPQRLKRDTSPPALRNLEVFSSYSIILSFDERLATDQSKYVFNAKNVATGEELSIKIKDTGTIGNPNLLPHQIWLETGEMALSATYQLTVNGIADLQGNAQSRAFTQNWTAPATLIPDEDTKPPAVIAVLPKSPTSLLVQFDEAVDKASAGDKASYAIAEKGGAGTVTVEDAALQPGNTSVLLTTGPQTKQADYNLTVSNISDRASPPNVLKQQVVAFKGFGDSTPPKVVFASAISPTEIVLAFDEPLAPLTATAAASYSISGLTVSSADFSGAATRKAAAFSPTVAAFTENVVVLKTSPMDAGKSYKVTPSGVTDLTGNACQNDGDVVGVTEAPKVDVAISYFVSGGTKVGGKIPSRAITAADVTEQREGLFILGSVVSTDGKTKDPQSPVTLQMGTFPPEGQPTAGLARLLKDDGLEADAAAGDNIHTILIKGVPLGTSLIWKGFASFTVEYANESGSAQAAFADKQSGPSVYSDGQEYPGNENGVRILGDLDGDGMVRINCLFGDEVSYKKFTNSAPFVWAVDDVSFTKNP
jgi:hypothetical protein